MTERTFDLTTSLGLSDPPDTSLLDIVDHLLDKGCVLTGQLVLGLANVDLVHVELSLLVSATDRLFRSEDDGADT